MLRLNNEQISSAVWFVVGTIIVIASVRYKLGSLSSPDTGFMPFLAGSAICLFSLIGLIQGTLKQKQGEHWTPMMKGLMWQKSLLVMGAILAYALLLKPLGFTLCTLLFLGFLFRAVKPLPWLMTIVGGILLALAAYGVFEFWLKAQLPKGPWGF
jgi:putative tricarboxylic transport membrane protein